MDYKIDSEQFEGPLDLLLHLIKKSNIDIQNINIEEITKQYLNYINLMEQLNLNIASEYLVMAAELLEIKSSSLLPKQEVNEEELEEDSKQNLIDKLIEYEKYKNITKDFKNLEEFRQNIYTKEPTNLTEYMDNNENTNYGFDLSDLIEVFSKFLIEKEQHKPQTTKIENNEYSIKKRCLEIKKIIKAKSKVEFTELFEDCSKKSVIITFLAILSLSKKQEILIEQKNNFNSIFLKEKGEF